MSSGHIPPQYVLWESWNSLFLSNLKKYLGPFELVDEIKNELPILTNIFWKVKFAVDQTFFILVKIFAVLPATGQNPVALCRMPFNRVYWATLVHGIHRLTTVLWLPVDAMTALKNDKTAVNWRNEKIYHISYLEINEKSLIDWIHYFF